MKLMLIIPFALAAAALTPCAAAQDAVASQPEAAAVEAAEEPEDRLRFEIGFEIVSAYFYHGILAEDDGLIFQPYASMEFDLGQSGDATFTLDAMIFGSWHDSKTGASDVGERGAARYESDYDVGITTAWDIFSLRLGCTYYASPNGAFDSYAEVSLALSIDDSEMLGPWALNPTIAIMQEIASDESGGDGMGPGTYLELGVTPGLDVTLAPMPEGTRLDFPVVLGLGLHDYYETGTDADRTFGFLSLGALLTVPLPWIDCLSAHAGVEYLVLGEAARLFNTDEDPNEWVWRVGMALSF